MFKGNKCNPFLVLIAIDSVGICMQQFHKDGLGWLLHGVCSMSCVALLRATHVVTQSGGSIPVLQPQFAPWTEVPGWGKPCGLSTPPSARPFAQPRWGIISSTSPSVRAERAGAVHPMARTWDSGSFQPVRGELPVPGIFSRQLLPAPAGGPVTRDVFVLPLLCSPHKAVVVTSLEYHRSDIATI